MLLQTANRKWHMADQIALILVLLCSEEVDTMLIAIA